MILRCERMNTCKSPFTGRRKPGSSKNQKGTDGEKECPVPFAGAFGVNLSDSKRKQAETETGTTAVEPAEIKKSGQNGLLQAGLRQREQTGWEFRERSSGKGLAPTMIMAGGFSRSKRESLSFCVIPIVFSHRTENRTDGGEGECERREAW